MSQSGFEKLYANREILVRIFKLLNFVDQLRLSRVCCDLYRIFQSDIWTQKYRILEIFNNSDNFVVMNESKTNLLNLNPDAFKEFLRYYAAGVDELIERRNWECVQDIAMTFQNLTRLNFGKREIEQNPLDFVAVNCPNLKSLRVYIKTSGDISSNQTLQTKSLLHMRHLKQLVLETDVNVVISLRQFRELVTNIQLENLVIGAIILLDEIPIVALDEALTIDPASLKELDVILSNVHPEAWIQNLAFCLKNCQNLHSLTLDIQRPTTINGEALQTIYQSCGNLEKFIIHNSGIEAEHFPIPPNVRELGFYSCWTLTADNLKQILSHPNLTKLTSIYSQYQERRLNDICPPWPLVQSLACDEWNTCHIKHIFRGTCTLKELRWNKTVAQDNDIASDGRLAECINLETLEWHGAMPMETIEKLQNLRKLTMSMPIDYIVPLLKHPSLVELCIPKTRRDKGMTMPILGVPTYLNSLRITRSIMLETMDFWLDLLNQNLQMKLICVYDAKEMKTKDAFLKDVIENQYFPKDLRTIDVWGYKINCTELRVNFEETISRIECDTSPFMHPSHKDMQRIVFCRKQ